MEYDLKGNINNIDLELLKKELKEAEKTLSPIILRNAGFDLPSWDSILKAMNLAFNTDPGRELRISPTEKRYNYLLVDEIFYFSNLLVADFKNNHNPLYEDFIGLRSAEDFLKSLFPNHRYPDSGANTMKFNLVEFTHTENPIHIDTQDMAYWHMAGKVKWGFDPKIHEEIIIQPNDIVIVPQGCLHGYYSLGPRAGVTFGFFK